MRSAAKVGERTLLVEGDNGVFGEVVDELYLILLLVARHELDCLFSGQLETLYGGVGLDYLLHFGLYLAEVLLRYGSVEVYVVVKAVFDYGTYRKFAGGENGLYRLGEHVRAGVTVYLKSLLVFQSYEFQLVPCGESCGKIAELIVDFDGNCISCKRIAYRFGGIHSLSAVVKRERIAVP